VSNRIEPKKAHAPTRCTPLFTVLALLLITGCASTDTTHEPTSPTSAVPVTEAAGISADEARQIAPLAPVSLTAVATDGTVHLTWPATGEDLDHYQLLRRTTITRQWTPIGQEPPDHTTGLDHPGAGTYVYGVQAINLYDTASYTTESHSVNVI